MRIPFIFLLLLISHPLLSQTAKDSLFNRSKGSWPFPIASFARFTSDETNHNESNEIGHKGIEFFSDGPDSVRAVFRGKVETIFPVDSTQVLIARYGDYFITYLNLGFVAVKTGQQIAQGQYIGRLPSQKKQIKVVITTRNDKEYDPYDWFLWTKEDQSKRMN
jgi:hypothetical protein